MPWNAQEQVRRRLRLALDYHRRGHLEQAAAVYRRVLAGDPHHPDALHLLGVLHYQRGEPEQAVELISQAIGALPAHAAFHDNLGNALQALDRPAEAVAAHRRALELAPRSAEAHNNLGRAWQKLADFDAARACYETACQLRPRYATAWLNLGLLLRERGRPAEAAESLAAAVRCDPEQPEAHFQLALARQEAGDVEGAIASYRRTCKLRPAHAESALNLGVLLQQAERWSEAVDAYQSLLRALPDSAAAHTSLGVALGALGQTDGAIAAHRRALELDPSLAEAAANLSSALFDAGRHAEVLAAAQTALEVRPDCAQARFNRGLARLALGDLGGGWEDYELRGQVYPTLSLTCAGQCWNGEPLHDKTIFVAAEQGLGTQIMFASCLPELIQRVGQCIVECDDRLVPLWSRSFPAARVVGQSVSRDAAGQPLDRYDVHLPCGSLSRWLRPDWNAFPRRPSYLHASELGRDRWLAQLARMGGALKVGVSWRGGRGAAQQCRRSVPLAHWTEVLEVPGASFVSVQYDAGDEELAAAAMRRPFRLAGLDARNDLEALACVLASLDLVICVDNSTAHLAGALGVPTWTLLPVGADWRWFAGDQACPWYPQMRLIRQTLAGQWNGPLAEVRRRLAELVASAAAQGRRAA